MNSPTLICTLIQRPEKQQSAKVKPWIYGIFLLYLLGGIGYVRANNIDISNVQLSGRDISSGLNHANNFSLITFDVSWSNSWRTNVPDNWDAAWIFAKFRVGTSDYLSAAGATNSGNLITVYSTKGLRVGMPVFINSGGGVIAPNTVITEVNSATTFTLSNPPTTPLSGGAVIRAERIWEHCYLHSGGHGKGSAGSLALIQVGLQDESLPFHPTDNPTSGIYFYRSQPGTGQFQTTGAHVRWNYGAQGLKDNDIVDIRVFGVEMVRVPSGSFYADTTRHLSGSVVLQINGDGTNGANNNIFRDGSSNMFTITRAGNPTQGSFSPFCGSGGSGYFDGNADRLVTPASAQFNFSTGPNTFEFWVYPLSLPASGNNCRLLMSGPNNSASSFVAFQYGSNGAVAVGVPLSGATGISSPAGTLQTGRWQHFAVVQNGATISIYKDGTQVTSGSITLPTSSNSNSFTIGYDVAGTVNAAFHGYISNVRITRGSALYPAEFTPSTSPLTATSGSTALLLSFANGGITDRRAKHNLETVDHAQVSTSKSKFGGGSVYFDGSGDYLALPPSTDFLFGTGDMTIEAWIYWDGTYNATGRIIYATGGSSSLDQFGIFSNTGLFWGGVYNNVPLNFPPVNQWCHVAASRLGDTIRLFINGVKTASGKQIASIGSSSVIPRIGMRPDGYHPFLGWIDDLRISKGVALYTSDFSIPNQTFPLNQAGGFLISSEDSLRLGGMNSGNLYYPYPTVSISNDFNASIIQTLPTSYPKGTQGFYIMKYEISQLQWISFYNTLTSLQDSVRDLTGSTGKNSDAIVFRNNIRWPGGTAAATLNSATHGNVACNYLNWQDGCAYADWACMRPITELEFEKAVRGPDFPVTSETVNASTCNGSSNLVPVTAIQNSGAGNEVPSSLLSNAVFGNQSGVQGPLRTGALARPGSSRATSGASFWGVMDLNGNVSEQVVSFGIAAGRSFVPAHGNGILHFLGHADVSGWPGFSSGAISGAAGSGKRGGSWEDSAERLLTADRFFGNTPISNRDRGTGFRGSRNNPNTPPE